MTMKTISTKDDNVTSSFSISSSSNNHSNNLPQPATVSSSPWPHFDVEETLSELTLDEKISLLSGKDFWHTSPVPRLSIPSLRFSDGPNGLRGTRFFNSVPSACLPCGTALAATFDTSLLERAGQLVSREALAKGVHVVLGPTVNTQRSPLGGRGFESFSEDPYLSGKAAAAIISGIQESGVAACIKHFVCNDQEHERMSCSSEVKQRAMREVYMRPFEMAIAHCKGERNGKGKKQPMALMTAYNRVNGTHPSECSWLVQDILREEWGFEGLAMSDWFGTYGTTEALEAGLDLEMPGPTIHRGKLVPLAINCGKISEDVIDDRVRAVLNLINNVHASGVPENAEEGTNNTPETAALLREIASSSIVLLNNQDHVLPLSKSKSTAVIGPNARVSRYCGGGSASLRPYYAVSPLEGIKSAVSSDVNVKYTLGAAAHKALPLLGRELTAPDGSTGFVLKFYTDPPTTPKDRVPVDTLYLDDSNVYLADYKNAALTKPVFYVDFVGTFTPEEDGEYSFGLTVHGTAKLYINGKLLIDNETTQRPGDSFLGVGTVEEIGSAVLQKDEKYEVLVQFATGPTSKLNPPGSTTMGSGGFRVGGALKISHKDEIQRAVNLAKEAEQVVLCVGLNADYESEGYDRDTTALPEHTDELIDAILEVNPNAVVVIQSGAPVTPSPTSSWPKKVKGVLQAWYGGNETGNAIADVLFGDVNPSGRLPLSFPLRCEDNPAYLNFGSEKGKVYYGEGVFVGYRYYDTVERDVWWRFGEGGSYTTFEFENVKIHQEVEDRVKVELDVRNSGDRDGAEVVQVYVAPGKASVRRPVKELKGFKKVFVKNGHSEKVEIEMDKKFALSYWDEDKDQWCMEAGSYDVVISESSKVDHDHPWKAEVTVEKTVWWRKL